MRKNEESEDRLVARNSGLFHLAISRKIKIRGVPTEKRVYLAQGSLIPSSEAKISQNLFCFSMQDLGISYTGFCDDFGPMNASSVVSFAQALQSIIVRHSGRFQYQLHRDSQI